MTRAPPADRSAACGNSDGTRQMTESIEQRMRRWLLEEASRNGAAVIETAAPSVWRYPYWPQHDVAWEGE